MGKKLLRKSVEVLDEADRFEDNFNWILFKQEQTNRLFYADATDEDGDEIEWRPGDDMYVQCSGGEDHWFVNSSRYSTNYVRPMFDLYDDHHGLGTQDSGQIARLPGKCNDCNTKWTYIYTEGDNKVIDPEENYCWNCGQIFFVYEYDKKVVRKKTAFEAWTESYREAVITRDMVSQTFDLHLHLVVETMREPLARAARSISDLRDRISQIDFNLDFSGLNLSAAVVDEISSNQIQWFERNMINPRAVVDDHLSPAPAMPDPWWVGFSSILERRRNRDVIYWPENVSFEMDIHLPPAPFAPFRPSLETRPWVNDRVPRRDR